MFVSLPSKSGVSSHTGFTLLVPLPVVPSVRFPHPHPQLVTKSDQALRSSATKMVLLASRQKFTNDARGVVELRCRGSTLIESSTKSQNPWDLLRHGKVEPGLVLLEERHKVDPSASHIMELGVAYLWVGKYKAAERHFQHAIRTHSTPGDVFYGMAGTAKWCMDEHDAAVKYWQSGLTAKYADAGGLGVKIPLLLFVGSVLKTEVFLRRNAEEILMRKTADPRAERWPGSLAKFVLGLDSNIESIMGFKPWPITALEEAERKRREEADKKNREWLVRFYGHILEFYNGVLTGKQLTEFMRSATDISQPEFSNHNFFLSLMWSEEFFVARHEAQNAPS